MQNPLKKLLGVRYYQYYRYFYTIWTYVFSVFHGYSYVDEKYKDSFLCNKKKSENSNQGPIPFVIYVFWTGNNEMSINRKEALESIRKKAGVPIILVTPENLNYYILQDHPLHPAYEFLSCVHKADYLRCYFMHFYGGGYVDIKRIENPWSICFDVLEKSQSYILGYREEGYWGVAVDEINDKNLENDLFLYWRLLVGNGSYICKPNTPFTAEWYNELNIRLDGYLEQLRTNPAIDPYGNENNYPIPWTALLGSIFHPLCLKYHDKILQSDVLRPSFENYR